MIPAQVRCIVAQELQRLFLIHLFFTQRQLQPPQRHESHDEEDLAEELEHISTQTLALTRYR